MGQGRSGLTEDDTPPTKLSERSLSAVAQMIKDGQASRIVVMTGAGISTAAGIPDFRSPNTGLYSNLARLNLPYAEAVFDISYFRQNPDPFYVLAKELYPGTYSPTVSHAFIALLAKKNLLRMLFTQNIDCLERQAGVPGELIVEAHGSFATQRCIECKTAFPEDKMKEYVFQGEVPRCEDKKCDGLVKPDIVFFGEQLPEQFHKNRHVPSYGDLALVIGTSLTVQPFASLPEMVHDDTPRVLFNLERVGSLGSRPDDVLVLGDCDSGVRKLADELGWGAELDAMWREIVGDKEAERQLRSAAELKAAMQAEVEDLADKVGQGLQFDDAPDSPDGDPASDEEKSHKSEDLRAIGSGLEEPSSMSHEAQQTSTEPQEPKAAPVRDGLNVEKMSIEANGDTPTSSSDPVKQLGDSSYASEATPQKHSGEEQAQAQDEPALDSPGKPAL
ncbi:NAD-dependent histone deacetylase SIR2 [Diaporthe helianthi]|uniref:NAD-dependent histone deacetylase SIR2 n=1 Tax=Diaporthe helianthi TaxID=158607 RepID=A0A2P5I519_DIAHE|nr:NAD-dependent histone deacetylase SIR2 [Diaporthe helianthi]